MFAKFGHLWHRHATTQDKSFVTCVTESISMQVINNCTAGLNVNLGAKHMG